MQGFPEPLIKLDSLTYPDFRVVHNCSQYSFEFGYECREATSTRPEGTQENFLYPIKEGCLDDVKLSLQRLYPMNVEENTPAV